MLRSKLDELTSNLTEEERRDLLEKINKSKDSIDGEFFLPVELQENERKQLILQEIGKLSLWKRFVLWFLKLITGKERDQVFLSLKLKEIKRSIRRRSPGLSGFETRDLSVKFAKYVYDLYYEVYFLKDFFNYYTKEASFREELVYILLSERYDKARNALADFLDIVELETIFAETNSLQNIHKMLNNRFDEYLKALPSSLFEELEKEFLPVVSLKNIVLFNYKELFQYFDYYLPPDIDKKYPVFRGAAANIVIDHLERLYYALHYALKNMENHRPLNSFILKIYLLHKEGLDPDKNKKEIERLKNKLEGEIANLKNHFESLVSQIIQFNQLVPLLDLIRYFKRDPFYRFQVYIPNLPLRQIYGKYLRRKLENELNTKLNEIKDHVIERKINELFKDSSMIPLKNYNDTLTEFYAKLGLPYFGRIRSLTLLYNYINKVYRETIQEIIQLISGYFFANNKRNQNRLLQYATAIEEIEDKIIWFDKSLSPEEEDGKTLMRLKYNIASDLTHQKLHKSFIAEREREATNLIEKGLEFFMGFKSLFDEFLSSLNENLQSILKTLIVWQNKQFTIKQLLSFLSANLGEFCRLLTQVMELEKGR